MEAKLPPERIIQAAVEQDGIVYTGLRHGEIIHTISTNVPGFRDESGKILRPVTGLQGFCTDRGRFVSREVAARLAEAAGQVQIGKASVRHVYNGRTLYSEDLW